jgi:hypothetical protein
MPRILELKAAEAGTMWVKIEMPGPQGELSILSREEIDRIKRREREIVFEVIVHMHNNFQEHESLTYAIPR